MSLRATLMDIVVFNNLNPGPNTFTAKYRTAEAPDARQTSISDRTVAVIGL